MALSNIQDTRKYHTSSKVHLDYACGPGTQIGLFSNSKSLGYDLSEKQVKYAIKKYKSKEKQFTTITIKLKTLENSIL